MPSASACSAIWTRSSTSACSVLRPADRVGFRGEGPKQLAVVLHVGAQQVDVVVGGVVQLLEVAANVLVNLVWVVRVRRDPLPQGRTCSDLPGVEQSEEAVVTVGHLLAGSSEGIRG